MSSELVDGVGALLDVDVTSSRPVGGGCISEAQRIELADERVVFAKSGARLPEGLLAAEAEGLRWLADAEAVRVPEVLALDDSVLVLEWIEPGSATATTPERLGRGLAELHAAGAPGFGADRDGFIGSLPQQNTPLADDWPTFWFTRRIEPLAQQARDRGSLPQDAGDLVSRLGQRLGELAGPPQAPARLHGDLWSGNVVVGSGGEPWVVDPAAYGGHREVDLAMLHLFGRPKPEVLDAYQDVWLLEDGWEERLWLWQLEPLLVHAVLFGGGYGAQAHQVLRRFT
jgi:fructosamine-3-kinase